MRTQIDVTIQISRNHIRERDLMGVGSGGVWFIMRGELVKGVCMGIEMDGW